MMTRQVNDATLALIKQWEGLRLDAYRDVAGVLTIGYGATRGVRPGQRITAAEAEAMLRADLERFEATVERLVRVPLNDNQFGALTSFAFNVGAHGFGTSTLLRRLNAGDYAAVPAELAKWNKAGGRVVAGLANRRAAEAGLWVRGDFVAGNTVAPQAPPNEAALQARFAGYATVAATAAPALSALGAVPQWVGVAAVLAVGAVALAVILQRQRAAA
ncbi:MAG TPA: lysozyme [Roseomonas sp.]|jgi:lysozyme